MSATATAEPSTPQPPTPEPSSRLAARLVPRTYRGVLRQPAFRRLLSALLVSYLGDGLSVVGISLLAMRIAPAGSAELVVGAALAAYALPAALGAVVLAPWLGRAGARPLLVAHAVLRAAAIGAAAVLALVDRLGPAGYVALLAASSLLGAWGNAGTYTMLSELFRGPDRLPANALVVTGQTAAIIVGPAIAGLAVPLTGPGPVVLADALTYVFLALQVRRITTGAGAGAGAATGVGAGASAARGDGAAAAREGRAAAEGRRTGHGFRLLARRPDLIGLIAVTAVFFFLYGPVEVALPLYAVDGRDGSAGLLGAHWTVFGVGALIGGWAGGLLVRVRPWPFALAVVAGWGLVLLPFGFLAPGWLTMLCLGVGGLVYGPFPAFNLALFQNAVVEPADLPAVLAARGAVTTAAGPGGILLGGPLVALLGAGGTLLASGAATVALAVLTAAVLLVAAVRRRRPPAGDLAPAGHGTGWA